MTKPSPFTTVLQTRVTSLADERLGRICEKLGISKADLLRLVVLRLVQGDIDAGICLRFVSRESSDNEMKSLRRSRTPSGEELL